MRSTDAGPLGPHEKTIPEPAEVRDRWLELSRSGPFFTGLHPHSDGYGDASRAKTVLVGAQFRLDAPSLEGSMYSAWSIGLVMHVHVLYVHTILLALTPKRPGTRPTPRFARHFNRHDADQSATTFYTTLSLTRQLRVSPKCPANLATVFMGFSPPTRSV